MADCPIFTPQHVQMQGNRLGLQSQIKREYDQSSASKMARDIDGEFNRLTTYYGCATVTFASLADGSSRAYNIPVHGPTFGVKYAVRVFVPIDMDGLHFSGYVSGDDRVTVVIDNQTGSAQQPAASFDMCVAVERFPAGQDILGMTLPDAGSAGGDTVITPPIGLGSLVLTGYAPTVTATTGNIAITPDLGNLILTGYAPSAVTATANHVIDTSPSGLFGLVITGYAPTVAIAAPTPLLLHFNGTDGATTTVDSGTYNHTLTYTGSPPMQLDTAEKKFGSASGLFSEGYVNAPAHSSLTLTGTDYTIEFWIFIDGTASVGTVVARKIGLNNFGSWLIQINAENQMGFYSSENTSSWTICNNLTFGTIPGNGWHHCAIVREGDVHTTYVDGTEVATTTNSGVMLDDSGNALNIGLGMDGWIDEFRIMRSAIFTGNFTPPTSEYSA